MIDLNKTILLGIKHQFFQKFIFCSICVGESKDRDVFYERLIEYLYAIKIDKVRIIFKKLISCGQLGILYQDSNDTIGLYLDSYSFDFSTGEPTTFRSYQKLYADQLHKDLFNYVIWLDSDDNIRCFPKASTPANIVSQKYYPFVAGTPPKFKIQSIELFDRERNLHLSF